jgi:hypothetical protein
MLSAMDLQLLSSCVWGVGKLPEAGAALAAQDGSQGETAGSVDHAVHVLYVGIVFGCASWLDACTALLAGH